MSSYDRGISVIQEGFVLSTVKIEIEDGEFREYETGITAGDVIRDIHGRKSGVVATLIDGIEKDMSTVLESNCKIEPSLLMYLSTC